MEPQFYHRFEKPPVSLAEVVETIGMFGNDGDQAKEIVVMPDGRIDLFFAKVGDAPFQPMLMGLETYPEVRRVEPGTRVLVISFKPLALEYVLGLSIASRLNSNGLLDRGFWEISDEHLVDFETFKTAITAKVLSPRADAVDPRKRKLFAAIYASNGEATVNELSSGSGWSAREINRYFNKWLGLSLKSYCNILRFRISLEHIAQGQLYPELNFTDQNHFIKTVKKFSGVVPRELAHNRNDRFVLLSVLKRP